MEIRQVRNVPQILFSTYFFTCYYSKYRKQPFYGTNIKIDVPGLNWLKLKTIANK